MFGIFFSFCSGRNPIKLFQRAKSRTTECTWVSIRYLTYVVGIPDAPLTHRCLVHCFECLVHFIVPCALRALCTSCLVHFVPFALCAVCTEPCAHWCLVHLSFMCFVHNCVPPPDYFARLTRCPDALIGPVAGMKRLTCLRPFLPSL